MRSVLARVRPFVGHPSNLWHDLDYKPGESPLLVLNSTYGWGTFRRMEHFLNGEVDFTFLLLIDGIISHGLRTRWQAMKRSPGLRLPTEQFLFAERLRELKPHKIEEVSR